MRVVVADPIKNKIDIVEFETFTELVAWLDFIGVRDAFVRSSVPVGNTEIFIKGKVYIIVR